MTHLVEIKDTSDCLVQGDGVSRTLPEFLTGWCSKKRCSDCEDIFVLAGFMSVYIQSVNQVYSRDDVAPLIGTTDLDGTGIFLVENVEVIGLQQLVCKLSERDALL